jgi:putative protease
MAGSQLRASLSKLGNTPFVLRNLTLPEQAFFIPTSKVNQLKNNVIEYLIEQRETHFKPEDSPLHYAPEQMLESASYKRNITNELHRAVYADFGVKEFEDGLDKTLDFKGKEVMVCKYCLRYELGLCSKNKDARKVAYPLYITNGKHKFQLQFDCRVCEMKIIAP